MTHKPLPRDQVQGVKQATQGVFGRAVSIITEINGKRVEIALMARDDDSLQLMAQRIDPALVLDRTRIYSVAFMQSKHLTLEDNDL